MSQGWKIPRNSGFFPIFFAGINFRGFNKTEYFADTNFRDFGQKPRKAQKLIPAKISTTKADLSASFHFESQVCYVVNILQYIRTDNFNSLTFPYIFQVLIFRSRFYFNAVLLN